MSLDRFLTNIKDYHIPVCVGVFGIGTALQCFHHLDMAFVAFTGTVLGAITGHAFSPAAQQPDPPATGTQGDKG
jgi:hypothetical protein